MREFVGLSMPPPLSLYIHIPWCIKKCPYCDFNSHEHKDSHNFADLESIYVDSLIKDLEYSLPKIWGRKIQSIFLGVVRQVYLVEKLSIKY